VASVAPYSYDIDFLPHPSPFTFHISPPFPIFTVDSHAFRGAYTRRDTGVPLVSLFLLDRVTIPLGVESRVCFGGERGLTWSACLDVRCVCAFTVACWSVQAIEMGLRSLILTVEDFFQDGWISWFRTCRCDASHIQIVFADDPVACLASVEVRYIGENIFGS